MNKPLQPSSKWTSHLKDAKIKQEFQMRLLQNKDLFRRLEYLVDVMKQENSRSRVERSSYDKPAWSESQADCNGYERALNTVLDYLKFSKE